MICRAPRLAVDTLYAARSRSSYAHNLMMEGIAISKSIITRKRNLPFARVGWRGRI